MSCASGCEKRMNCDWPQPTDGWYEFVSVLMPHGSGSPMICVPGGAPLVVEFTFRTPFMTPRMDQNAMSLPVSGTLKSRTAFEYLFHTVTWAMTPGVDTFVIDTRVSVPPPGVGAPV